MKSMMTGHAAPTFDNTDAGTGGGNGSATDTAPAPTDLPSPPAPAAGAEPAPAGSSTPAPSSPNGQPSPEPEYEIKVDGKTIKLPLSKLLEHAQKGTDYTLKTQALAEERRRDAAEREQHLRTERAKWEKEYQESQRRRVELEKLDPGSRALREVEVLKQQNEDTKLDAAIASVRGKFPDVNEQLLLATAQHRQITDYAALMQIAEDLDKAQNGRFETRFDALLSKGEHPRVKALKEAAIAEYLKGKIVKPTHIQGGGSAPGGEPPKKVKTFDEADQASLAALPGE